MKIGYLCKYAPIEVLQSMGAEVERIMPEVTDFSQADMLMHANMCSFIKGVLEEFESGETGGAPVYGGLLLTNCCDSTRRLYDVMKERYPDKFIYLTDIPRTADHRAADFFAGSVRKLAHAYSQFSGVSFSADRFREFLRQNNCAGAEKDQDAAAEKNSGENAAPLNIGLMGARCSRGVLEMIRSYNINLLFDMTCTGVDRRFEIDGELLRSGGKDAPPSGAAAEEENDERRSEMSPAADRLLSAYSGQLLCQIPCMRMNDTSARDEMLRSFEDHLDGIIYHTVKFCDNYSYEYAALYDNISASIQKFETDATSQCEGQIRTRVEAFLESLLTAKGLQTSEISRKGDRKERPMDGKIHVLGIDSGSTSTNAVILNQDRKIEAYAVVRTGAKSGESAEAVLAEVLGKASLSREDIDLIVSTGYGRVSIPFADRNVTEISCHGKGAHYFNPEVRTVLDIGGQDSKAIRLNEKGDVIDFVMNDKCAAGTGRFLEMMARTLEVDIERLGEESLRWKEDLDISSMCSVFAESEVISLIANNKEKCDIAHGIHKAVANKSISLMKRVGLEPGYMMTGGVAKNPGAVREIEEKLGQKLFICEEPEIVGACGAAVFGLEELTAGKDK